MLCKHWAGLAPQGGSPPLSPDTLFQPPLPCLLSQFLFSLRQEALCKFLAASLFFSLLPLSFLSSSVTSSGLSVAPPVSPPHPKGIQSSRMAYKIGILKNPLPCLRKQRCFRKEQCGDMCKHKINFWSFTICGEGSNKNKCRGLHSE